MPLQEMLHIPRQFGRTNNQLGHDLEVGGCFLLEIGTLPLREKKRSCDKAMSLWAPGPYAKVRSQDKLCNGQIFHIMIHENWWYQPSYILANFQFRSQNPTTKELLFGMLLKPSLFDFLFQLLWHQRFSVNAPQSRKSKAQMQDKLLQILLRLCPVGSLSAVGSVVSLSVCCFVQSIKIKPYQQILWISICNGGHFYIMPVS